MARVGRDLKAHLVPTPCHRQGFHPLNQVAQSLVQPGLECPTALWVKDFLLEHLFLQSIPSVSCALVCFVTLLMFFLMQMWALISEYEALFLLFCSSEAPEMFGVGACWRSSCCSMLCLPSSFPAICKTAVTYSRSRTGLKIFGVL